MVTITLLILLSFTTGKTMHALPHPPAPVTVTAPAVPVQQAAPTPSDEPTVTDALPDETPDPATDWTTVGQTETLYFEDGSWRAPDGSTGCDPTMPCAITEATR